ncbi:MAG: MFS transporter, partial [Lachnospiraceae bacterium]|nr:MFS transporter [Lachnospiraceae bacterium]
SDTRKNELNFENDSVNINYSGNKQNDLKIEESNNLSSNSNKVLSLKEIISIQGVKEVMLAFFCYCAIEQTAGLWASSYLVLHRGISVSLAANFASFFFIGITVGRGVNGFLTFKFNDTQLIRIGEGIILIGIIMMLLPFGSIVSLVGLIFIGLGCAPIYPCIIHSTPTNFGETHSGAIIGVQMASAYVGTCLMPPIFGLIANYINVALLPMFLFVILVLMFITYEMLLKKVK